MRKVAAAFFLAVFCCLSLYAERFGPISVEEVPQASSVSHRFGYLVREYRVGNDGANPAEVRLRLCTVDGMDFSAERKLLIAPGTVRNVILYLPSVTDSRDYYGSGGSLELELIINGRPVRHSLPAYGTLGGLDYRNLGDILVSGMVPLPEYRKYWTKTGSEWNRRRLLLSDIPVSQWGVSLRDYSSFDFIWISSVDRVPPAVERALMNWVFSGGTLVVCVPAEAAWPETEVPKKNEPLILPYGWGTRVVVRPVFPGMVKPPESVEEPEQGNPFKETEKVSVELTPGLALFEMQQTDQAASRLRGMDPNFNQALLMLPIPGVPLSLLFFVMLAFVVVIGPVNFLILRKLRREPLILLTTPVISLVFCFAVILFITFHEGWYSRAKARGITLLDQDAKLGATRAAVSVYSPIAPRSGFRFGSEDVLRISGAGRVLMNEDDDQWIAPGLLQPRMPLNYSIERVAMQREHLKLTREKDGLGVVNGLGVRLTRLIVTAPDGKVFQADGPIEPGARALLRATKHRMSEKLPDLNMIQNAIEKNKGIPSFLFVPGYYVAVAEEPVFWTPGFKPDQFEVEHVVIGKYSFAGDSKDGN